MVYVLPGGPLARLKLSRERPDLSNAPDLTAGGSWIERVSPIGGARGAGRYAEADPPGSTGFSSSAFCSAMRRSASSWSVRPAMARICLITSIM